MDSSMSTPMASSSYSATSLSSTAATEQFRYVQSCDLEEHVQVRGHFPLDKDGRERRQDKFMALFEIG